MDLDLEVDGSPSPWKSMEPSSSSSSKASSYSSPPQSLFQRTPPQSSNPPSSSLLSRFRAAKTPPPSLTRSFSPGRLRASSPPSPASPNSPPSPPNGEISNGFQSSLSPREELVNSGRDALPLSTKLGDILCDQILRDIFRDFCYSELAGENFDFWEEVEVYKKIESEDERRTRFNQMYQRFFDLESEHEMNVSGPDRVKIDTFKSSEQCPPKDVFNRLQRVVHSELSTEMLYRFLRSSHLKKALLDKEDPEGAKKRREKLEKFFGVKIDLLDV